MTYQNEAQTWESMQETMQELQEMEILHNETGHSVSRTQAVVIRIQLLPSRGPIFGHPRRIAGATGITQAPLTGKTIVPVREVDAVTGEVSNGIVYAPEIGSNEFEFAFLGKNALKFAGNWLGKQITKMPKLAQRINGVKTLVGGKPCPGCERGFASKIGKLLPRKLNIGFNRDPNTRQWKLDANYQDQSGRDYNMVADGLGKKWQTNFTGHNADGSDVNLGINRDGRNWQGNGYYRDLRGNIVNADVQGSPGQFNADADGTVAGNNFGLNAAADGDNYNGYGYMQNNQGYGGAAISGRPGQLQAQGAYISPNMNANANVNWNREMESSVLEEVFQEIGI